MSGFYAVPPYTKVNGQAQHNVLGQRKVPTNHAKNVRPTHSEQLQVLAAKPRLIDAMQAQHGALHHLLRFERDKIQDAKGGNGGREITPEHFQDETSRELAQALWTFYEDSSRSYDAETFDKYLQENSLINAFALWIELQATPKQRPPRWEECLHTILNYALTPAAKAAKTANELVAIVDGTPDEFPLNEIGNGQRFAARHGAYLRFCAVREKWQIFKEGRWQADESGIAEQRAKLVAQAVAADAGHELDDDKRARLLKHALVVTTRRTREIMLKDAASEDGMMVTPEQFDVNPHLFNCANGTIHLPSGTFRAHHASDLLTLQSPIVFDANADCPTWRVSMKRWVPDEATRKYLQESFGVSLSGRVFEEFFNFLYGGGDNGKSTFLRVLENICGTYWHKTQAETIMQARDKRNGEAASPSLLALKGARLVTVHEIDSKHALNTTLIKDLTGRDAITARGLFEKRPTTFEPQFTLWMFGNGKPQIKDASDGMWRRVRLIDFGQPISPNERDPLLSDKFTAELPGILNWALEGLRRVHEGRLIVPDAVNAATAEYRAEQDAMSGFLSDCCVSRPNCAASAAKLWEAWGAWCRANGEREGTQRAFGLELKRRKFDKASTRDGVQWRGIGLALLENEPKPL